MKEVHFNFNLTFEVELGNFFDEIKLECKKRKKTYELNQKIQDA
jgi:hypothetical protein